MRRLKNPPIMCYTSRRRGKNFHLFLKLFPCNCSPTTSRRFGDAMWISRGISPSRLRWSKSVPKSGLSKILAALVNFRTIPSTADALYGSHLNRLDIGIEKVVAFEQQWLVHLFCQRIREAVSKIQSRSVASLAKIAVSLAGDLCLPRGNRFHRNMRHAKEIIEAAPGNMVSSSVDYDGGFHVAHS